MPRLRSLHPQDLRTCAWSSRPKVSGHQCRTAIQHPQPELPCDGIAEGRRPDLGDGQAAGGDDQGCGPEAAAGGLHDESGDGRHAPDARAPSRSALRRRRIRLRACRMMSLAERSQNNWPSVFSWYGIWWRSTRRTKSAGLYRAKADLAKCGFAEWKFSGRVWRLVKLQRPPPEIRIFRPICGLCSTTRPRRPRLPASIAHIRPAAPAPMTATSKVDDGMLLILAKPAVRGVRDIEVGRLTASGADPGFGRVIAYRVFNRHTT